MIEQATGVISERAGADLAEALSRLRGYARHHNLILTDVALSAAPRLARGPGHPPGAILTAWRQPRTPLLLLAAALHFWLGYYDMTVARSTPPRT